MESQNRRISFSPPDVGQAELDEISEALLSGWITTGPKTKKLENKLAAFTGAAGVACLNSATAALECALRLLGIGPGDEVITSAYTYTASASCICHVGAKPVLADVAPNSFEIDYDRLPEYVTDRTRAIIPVDYAGRMCDYRKLFEVLESPEVQAKWQPGNEIQGRFGRIPVIADAAHSLGAEYRGTPSGSVADLTAFSFHAVKNLTTAEGGALAWRACDALPIAETYKTLMLMSLHGQDKDALAKNKAGAWEYDILFPGYKCNMTDLTAAMGLAQLRRYPSMLDRRREILSLYEKALSDLPVTFLQHAGDCFASSAHLAITRLDGKGLAFRNALINALGECGIASNVHYKPLPLLTAYKNLGYCIDDFPNSLAMYENELTLPLHTLLSDDDVAYICEMFRKAYAETEEREAKGVL